MKEEKNRAVITVVGTDKKGIISTVTTLLADHEINIMDISQTIMDTFFTMVMLIDLTDCDVELDELNRLLKDKGDEIGMVITCQHEDLFRYMHRI